MISLMRSLFIYFDDILFYIYSIKYKHYICIERFYNKKFFNYFILIYLLAHILFLSNLFIKYRFLLGLGLFIIFEFTILFESFSLNFSNFMKPAGLLL